MEGRLPGTGPAMNALLSIALQIAESRGNSPDDTSGEGP